MIFPRGVNNGLLCGFFVEWRFCVSKSDFGVRRTDWYSLHSWEEGYLFRDNLRVVYAMDCFFPREKIWDRPPLLICGSIFRGGNCAIQRTVSHTVSKDDVK